MANALSSVGTLAQEVATLLGFDNIDARIYQWIGMVYNDVLQREPADLFYTKSVDTIATGADSTELGEQVGTPVAAIFTNDDKVYFAMYITENDFDRKIATGATVASSTIPLYWTIRNDGSTQKIYINPPASGETTVTLLWLGNYLATPPSSGDYLSIPYHFEHVIVWGAAALGAQVLRMNSYALFASEFEEHLMELHQLMGYKPSSVPVMRSVTGPYTGTHRFMAGPRFPQNING